MKNWSKPKKIIAMLLFTSAFTGLLCGLFWDGMPYGALGKAFLIIVGILWGIVPPSHWFFADRPNFFVPFNDDD